MKKSLSLAAILLTAVTINAQIAVTCAEAVAAMPAQSGSETEEVYLVTGYVTNSDGTISPSRTDVTIYQQKFYMDDEKGTKKTLQGYWCNLPGNEALNVGDKITLKGKILNYNNTPEIKNGDVAILERATEKIDTIEVDVCEALEEGESLQLGDYTHDVFAVSGRIKGTDAANNYGRHTFKMACDAKTFISYNCKGEDGLELSKGDSVVVTGKLYNYNGIIEISNGTVKLIEKNTEPERIYKVNVSEAIEIAMALGKNEKTDDRYAITGFVSAINTEYSASFHNISFYMSDDMENPTTDFIAYRVIVTEDEAAKVVTGAKVTVIAALQHYYREGYNETPELELIETTAGGTILFWGNIADCKINILNKNEMIIGSGNTTISLPEPPFIEDFTFVGWDVVAGHLADGITIQATYSYNGIATSAPSEVSVQGNPVQKLIRNGNIYILIDNSTYSIQGQELK